MGSGFVFHNSFMKPIFNSLYYPLISPFGGFLCKYWIDMNNSLVLIKIILSYSHYTHQQEDTLGLTHSSFILLSELETYEQEFGTDFFLVCWEKLYGFLQKAFAQ